MSYYLMLKLVKYDKLYLDKSWEWLNDEVIKKLTNTPDFTRKQQLEWFNDIHKKGDYLIWGIEIDNQRAGACGLKRITGKDAEYWGYIGDKRFWGQGYGKQVLQILLDKAVEMRLESIWLKVGLDNLRAIRLYKSSGFEFEKQEEELQIMKKFL